MPQLVTNSRGDVRDVSHTAADATKTWGGLNGAWGSLLGISGTYGRNQDLAATRQGAAAAYQLVPPINRAVNLRANAVNALTWKLMSADGEELDNSENAVPQSDFGRMLKRAHQYSRIPLLGQISYSYDLYGECYLEPLGNGYRYNGVKWLNPLGMWVDVRDGMIAGYRWSSVSGNDSNSHTFAANEIAYDHTFNPFDDFRGQGLVEVAMDTINIDRNLQRYMQAFFRNNAMPNVVVSPKGDQNWDDKTRQIIKTQVENYAKGSDNAFSTLVAPMPADWTTFDPPDIQNYYSIDEPLTRKILMIFGVPLAMAGDETGARYKTGKDVLDAFYLNTIIPLATSVRDYVNNQLLPFFDDSGATFQFDVSAYDQVSEDDERRSRVANANYQGRIWSQQEARAYTKQDEQLDPLDTLFDGQQPATPPSMRQQGATDFTVEQTPQGRDEAITIEKSAQRQQQRAPLPPALKQTSIEAELAAWGRKASKGNALKAFVCAATPPHVEAFVRDELETLGADANKRAVKALFDDAALLVARKDYDSTEYDFIEDLEPLISGGNDGELSAQKLSAQMRSTIRRFGLIRMREGMNAVGKDPESLDAETVQAFREWMDSQSAYISSFVQEVTKAGISPDEVRTRAEMWNNRTLESAYEMGMRIGNVEALLEWVEGGTHDKCVDCLRLNGQVHTMREWLDSGYTPTSGKTACRSFNCRCSLRPTDKKTFGDF